MTCVMLLKESYMHETDEMIFSFTIAYLLKSLDHLVRSDFTIASFKPHQFSWSGAAALDSRQDEMLHPVRAECRCG